MKTLTSSEVSQLLFLLDLFEHELRTTIRRAGMCTEHRVEDVQKMIAVLKEQNNEH